MVILVDFEPMYPGFESRGSHEFFFIIFLFFIFLCFFCHYYLQCKGLGSIRGVFGPMSKISFTLSNYSFVIWDKNYRRYFVI